MADRWVNAVVEFTIALEVAPDASAEEKLAAAERAFEKHFEDAAAGHVATIGHETAEDGEPVEVDPAVCLDALYSAVKEEVERLRGKGMTFWPVADRLQEILDQVAEKGQS